MEENSSNRASFQAGKFPQMPRPPGVDTAPAVEKPIADEDLPAAGIVGEPADACDEAASEPDTTDTSAPDAPATPANP
jgi:hypothetical protein